MVAMVIAMLIARSEKALVIEGMEMAIEIVLMIAVHFDVDDDDHDGIDYVNGNSNGNRMGGFSVILIMIVAMRTVREIMMGTVMVIILT